MRSKEPSRSIKDTFSYSCCINSLIDNRRISFIGMTFIIATVVSTCIRVVPKLD